MKKIGLFFVLAFFLGISLIFTPVNVNAEGEETPVIESEEVLENEDVLATETNDAFSFPLIETGTGEGDTGTFSVTNPGETVRYPNSTIAVRSGDVLVSDKSWDATKFVGHAAIVGSDFLVREVLPGTTPGKTRTLSAHRVNQSGGSVRIYRHPNATARTKAGVWAVNNIKNVSVYHFTTGLNSIYNNYCSKFVWQAFNKNGYSAGTIDNLSIVGTTWHGYVYPNSFKNNMTYIGTYK